MKTLKNIFVGLLFTGLLTTGCESLLDVNSDRLVFPEDNILDSPNDTIYSMVGILSKVQKLADRYVLLGELRGDLMTVNEDADIILKEINDFNISDNNPFNNIGDYYAVINHCNYLINNIDTTIVSEGEKVMYKEYAAAKGFRAWAYMQLALNYGSAKYYTDPILTIADAEKNYPEYTIEELAPFLIADLDPVKMYDHPGAIALGTGVSTFNAFFPIRALLGDLYLWSGQYEMAAREYHALIVDEEYLIGELYQSLWSVENGVFVEREPVDQNFLDIFDLGGFNAEIVTLLNGSTEFGEGSFLDSISFNYNMVGPSDVAIDNWDSQSYYNTATEVNLGDLRGDYGSYLGDYYYQELVGFGGLEKNQIVKYVLSSFEDSKSVIALRVATLYLRYAEAVNRAEKPNLAFAVLKNGMSNRTLAIDTIVPPREKYSEYTDSTSTLIEYVDFSDLAFNNTNNENLGVHSRGCGNIHQSLEFIIPDLPTLEDSIEFVEEQIIMELALETAFEGNRFHDLMRIAKRRNDNSYLADKVAEKYADKESIRAKLMDENNWYLTK